MKQYVLTLIAVAFIFCGCTKEQDNNSLVPITVKVSDFAISQSSFEMAKSSSVASYSGVKYLTLAFYDGSGAEVYKHTQQRTDNTTYSTFGEYSLSLSMGSYTMVVIGHGCNTGEPAVALVSPTEASFGDYPARETFVATQSVNINSTDAVAISATLDRVVSKLQVLSTDGRSANVKSVRMTFAGGSKSFSPTTGLASDNLGFSNAVDISTAVGEISNSNSYLFLTTDEQTMNVTIETLDNEGQVVSSHLVENVPFKRNRVTRLTGSLYSANAAAGSFQVNSDWLDTYDVEF